MTCTLVLISFSVGLFFACLTVVVIVMAAAEIKVENLVQF